MNFAHKTAFRYMKYASISALLGLFLHLSIPLYYNNTILNEKTHEYQQKIDILASHLAQDTGKRIRDSARIVSAATLKTDPSTWSSAMQKVSLSMVTISGVPASNKNLYWVAASNLGLHTNFLHKAIINGYFWVSKSLVEDQGLTVNGCTGVAITPELLLAEKSCFRMLDKVRIKTHDGNVLSNYRTVGEIDGVLDIIQVGNANMQPATVGTSEISFGAPVVVFGVVYGIENVANTGLSSGYIENISNDKFLVTSGFSYFAHNGHVISNLDGEIVGISVFSTVGTLLSVPLNRSKIDLALLSISDIRKPPPAPIKKSRSQN